MTSVIAGIWLCYKKVSVLSPGEKARVALCKILTKRANVIILDEPTNHFDPETQKLIGENFRDYDFFEYTMENDGKVHDISVEGLGWISFVAKGQVIRVMFPKGSALKESLGKLR